MIGKAFAQKWFEEKGSTIVGRSMSALDCPLANCLTETVGGNWVRYSVSPFGITAMGQTNRCAGKEDGTFPHWMSRFVSTLDKAVQGGAPVNGRLAAGLLAGIPEN